MKKYRMIDHTADIAVEVYGETLAALFANSAAALFDIILGDSKIEPHVAEAVRVSANDQEQLLVTWLSEFIYLFDTKRLVFSKFDLDRLTDTRLEGTAAGEAFDPMRHRIHTEIKAVTYHGLKIEKKGPLYTTAIVFDI